MKDLPVYSVEGPNDKDMKDYVGTLWRLFEKKHIESLSIRLYGMKCK